MAGTAVIKNKIIFVVGLAGFLFCLLAPLNIDTSVKRTLGLLFLCGIWWGTEAIPMYITSLLPGILFPLLGIISVRDVLGQYAHPIIFLLLGSFLIAHAIMKCHIDKRLTLNILARSGTNPRLLLLYFMIATAMISAFISNTATAAMMYPIGLAVLHNVHIEDEPKYRKILMLGIAYAATIGGMITLVGTAGNMVCAAYAKSLLGKEITFIDWLKAGLPFSLILLFVTWTVLLINFKPRLLHFGQENAIKKQLEEMGPFDKGQKITIFVFLLAAGLWSTRCFWHLIPIKLAADIQSRVGDSGIAMFCAILLFVVPFKTEKWNFVLGLKDVKYASWKVIILYGGGLCLGKGLFESGAAAWIANSVHLSPDMHPLLLMLIFISVPSFISEFAPNTTVTNMMVPIVIAACNKLGISAEPFLIPVTLACGTVFMLPLATPAIAIVYGSGYIRMRDMIKVGFVLHLIGILILTFLSYFMIGKFYRFGPL